MKQKPKDEQVIDVLKRLAKRIEEATVDIHEIKIDLKWQKMKVASIEDATSIMKVDIENMKGDLDDIKGEMVTMKKDIKDLKRNTEDLMENDAEILAKIVTQEEHRSLSKRVSALEHQ